MAGKVVNICPRRSFAFDGLGAGWEVDVVLAERIDIGFCDRGDLVVRLHDVKITEGNFYIAVVQDGYTQEDPATSFLGDFVAGIKIESTDTAPGLKIESFTTSRIVPTVAVKLTAAQGPSEEALQVTLSCDLVLRYRST